MKSGTQRVSNLRQRIKGGVQSVRAFLENAGPWMIWAAVFATLMIWEMMAPLTVKRPEAEQNGGDERVSNNFALGIAMLLLSAALPLGAYEAAVVAKREGFGIFSAVSAHWGWQLAGAVLCRSAASYGMHRLSHRIALLWNIHAVHHSDTAIDVSTGFRHHPLEIVVMYPSMLVATLALGVSPAVAVAAATIAYAFSFWQHAAIQLPARLERALQTVIVTPALHRNHHSPDRPVHDSNFGDDLIIWDRLFGTYRAAPKQPEVVGLHGEGAAVGRLTGLLLRPFRAVRSADVAEAAGWK